MCFSYAWRANRREIKPMSRKLNDIVHLRRHPSHNSNWVDIFTTKKVRFTRMRLSQKIQFKTTCRRKRTRLKISFFRMIRLINSNGEQAFGGRFMFLATRETRDSKRVSSKEVSRKWVWEKSLGLVSRSDLVGNGQADIKSMWSWFHWISLREIRCSGKCHSETCKTIPI